MMKHTKSRKESAVSPVVGVMLMLVVTILIAAVVSAFAGGLMSSPKKPTNVLIQATYSQSSGMTITNAGGDSIALSTVQFETTPSEQFGADFNKFTWIFDKSYLLANNASGTPVLNPTTGFYYTTALSPGESVYVNTTGCMDYYSGNLSADGYTDSSHKYTTYGTVNNNAAMFWGSDNGLKEVYYKQYEFMNPANVGKSFTLTLIDPRGSVIASTDVKITS